VDILRQIEKNEEEKEKTAVSELKNNRLMQDEIRLSQLYGRGLKSIKQIKRQRRRKVKAEEIDRGESDMRPIPTAMNPQFTCIYSHPV
jgi:hypothetical protein